MKPTVDPVLDYKRLVAEGYNFCAEIYEPSSRQPLLSAIKWLKNKLPNRARVLDIGCGNGLPLTRELAKRFAVTGVDISFEQIRRARDHIRHAEFFHSDIMGLDFPVASFEAVVAFQVIVHIPRGEHERLFRAISRWLTPGGYLLVTLARESQEGYLQSDFFGTPMFWSHYSLPEYRALLTETGFDIVDIQYEQTDFPLALCKTTV
ncbi:MAG: hypothetical protein DDG60_07520 [Anaerolineae bacterium]|nr:MAG: hypothetical protein DDG60_07520 [Anaerolineae bacterium]